MGCSTSGSIIHPQQVQDTLYGVLKIHLVGGLLEGELNSPNSQVTAICKMSNQQFRGKQWTKASFTNINEVYEFMVNSRYQRYGRSLQIQLVESGLFSQNSVGVGLADLQLIIRERKRENFKIYLTSQNNKVGWIQLQVLFQQFPTFPITLLFDSVLVRRKPTSLGDLSCRIRTTIGQQVLVSNFCLDKQDQPPSWKTEKFTFHILKGIIRQGKVQVLHNDKQIGALSLNIEQIEQSSESQIEISEQFYYGDNIIAGTIKFFINKGDDINSISLQMKKSSFISPSKKKLPPLNAQFKSNDFFKRQLQKQNPKIGKEEKIVIEHQLQNELDHQSLDTDKQEESIKGKIHDNERNTNSIIIKEEKKERSTDEVENKRKEEEQQNTRLIQQQTFQRKLRQQQQNRLRLLKEEKQKQQKQAQIRASELKQKLKQQQDQKILQEEQRKLKQLKIIKIKQEEDRMMKLQQEQNRIKLFEEARRIKQIEELVLRQEQKRKKLQDEERILRQLQAKKLLQQEEIKKKILEQAEEKRRIQEQQEQYRKNQQLRLIQQKRKADQLKKQKEQEQAILKNTQLQIIRAKEELIFIEKQQTQQRQERQKQDKELRKNEEKQLQKRKMDQLKILEQVKIKQLVQKSQQIIKQSTIKEEQILKTKLEISQKNPQIRIEDIQRIPPISNMQQYQIHKLNIPHKQQEKSVSRQKSKHSVNVISQEIKPITKQYQQSHINTTGIDIAKPIQLNGSNSDQNSHLMAATDKKEQTILPNQRQHSRLLLESAFLENGSDDQQDK